MWKGKKVSAVFSTYSEKENVKDFIESLFNLKYIDNDGKEKKPVVLHRVILGSLERFIGALIEHYGGLFPYY